MNAVDASLAPALARLDREGRLIEADARLLDLVRRAGGGIGTALPLPELAAVASLARRLGISIARAVTVADGEDDLELWVRAEPVPDGVALVASGWAQRPTWQPAASANRLDTGFAATEGDWHWETDAALRLTHVTHDAGAKWGFDAGAALGQPLLRLFALAEDGDGGLPILGAVATQARFEGQQAMLRATGRPVRLSATPRVDERGRFAGLSGSVEMLGEDAAGAAESGHATLPEGLGAHLDRSLRGPLERIVANASSMSAGVDGPLDETYAGYADDIVTAGRHLLGMIADLADLDAIERDDFAVEPDAIDLADIARRAAGLLAVRAAEGEVRIDRPADHESLPARGDFRRALQVLVNLIGNAVRYSPPGGIVWVRAEREGASVCVIVADQGKGIATEDQARIFDKFGRVDPGEPGGSGLGLYISRRLARAMGGDIVVDSAPGQGARFIFTLPAR